MEREAEAFRRLHPDLLAAISGEYAAIYSGQLSSPVSFQE